MKKIIALFVLVFVVSTTVVAQKNKGADVNIEQQASLELKKMTLAYDLTASQQRQIKPLLTQKFIDKKEWKEKRRALKQKKGTLSQDEKYKMKNEFLDKQIVFKTEMKKVLNENQYEKFSRSFGKRKGKMKEQKRHHKS